MGQHISNITGLVKINANSVPLSPPSIHPHLLILFQSDGGAGDYPSMLWVRCMGRPG